MSKSLLVTGCGGFVGGAIVHQAHAEWELHAISRGGPLIRRPGVVWHTLDLLDTEELQRQFHAVKPSAVIHAAAVADIDFCEANKNLARRVNVDVTRELASMCVESGARMVYVSTDTVYDGKNGPYTEEDLPSPLSYYAETKAEAERIVAAMPGNWAVARSALVMGLPLLGAGNSFLSRMLPTLEAGKELHVPDNEIRSPIDVVTLARALLELARNDYVGYLHLAGNDSLNRCEMVRRIARKLGLPERLVIAKQSGGVPGWVPRPLNAPLCNRKARAVLRTPMLGLEDGLDLVLTTKKGVVL